MDGPGRRLLPRRLPWRGQLTAAEQLGLGAEGQESLNDLINCGLVAKVGGVWVATEKLTPTTADHDLGTGDSTDTITIYWDGTHAIGTTVVAAADTWSIVVFVPVGWHDLTATQTVNELPHVGLTSDQSCDVDVTVHPDPPKITFTSIPGPATSSTPVTVSDTGDRATRSPSTTAPTTSAAPPSVRTGTWSLTLNFGVGGHSLTAMQTWSRSLTSDSSDAATVTVYPPPPVAPTIGASATATTSSSVTLSSSGVAGDTITLYDGGTAVGTVTVAANGSWTLTVKLNSGTHTITATDTLTAGVTSAPTAPLTVVVPPR